MKKPRLDCPLCSVIMKPVGKSPIKTVPSYFICPICKSMFSPYMGPEKEEWIKTRIANLTD